MNSLPARLRTPTALSAARRDAHRSGTSGRAHWRQRSSGSGTSRTSCAHRCLGRRWMLACDLGDVAAGVSGENGGASGAGVYKPGVDVCAASGCPSHALASGAAACGCGGGVGMVGADGRSGRGAHRRAVDAAPRRAPAGRWRPLLMLAAATPQRSFVVAAVRFSHGGLLAVVRRCLGCDRCVCFARSIVSREGMPEPWPHRTAAATDGGAARRGADVEPEGCPFGASSERRLAAEPGPAPMRCPQASPA